MLHLNLPLETVKQLCPNLQKPPLPSKIPCYAPVYRSHFLKVADCRPAFFFKKDTSASIGVFLRNFKKFSKHLVHSTPVSRYPLPLI